MVEREERPSYFPPAPPPPKAIFPNCAHIPAVILNKKQWGEKKKPHHDVRLVIIGGARNENDKARVKHLRELTEQLGLQVFFFCNTPMTHTATQ